MTDDIGSLACCFHSLQNGIYILRIDGKHQTNTHVEGIVHYMLLDISLFLEHAEDGRNFIAALLDDSVSALRKHTRNVLVETAAGDVAAAFYGNACLFDALHGLYIDFGRSQKGLAKGFSKLFMVGIQSLFVHLEDAADQRKAVAVNAADAIPTRVSPALMFAPVMRSF